MQSAKLRNPDLVGMSVLIRALFVRDCQAGRVVLTGVTSGVVSGTKTRNRVYLETI
jgi:hypothetical protein